MFRFLFFFFFFLAPPVAVQIMGIAKIKKGSAESNRVKVASISWDQVREIAEGKMVDMNAFEIKSAMSMVAGTARSMGVKVSGKNPFAVN